MRDPSEHSRRQRKHGRLRRKAATTTAAVLRSRAAGYGQSRQRRTLAHHGPSGVKAVAKAASATSAAASRRPRKRAPRRLVGDRSLTGALPARKLGDIVAQLARSLAADGAVNDYADAGVRENFAQA